MSTLTICMKSKFSWLTVEPMILLYWGAWNMTSTIRQDFFLSVVCKNLYLSSDVCKTEYNDTIKHEIESKVLVFFLYYYLFGYISTKIKIYRVYLISIYYNS